MKILLKPFLSVTFVFSLLFFSTPIANAAQIRHSSTDIQQPCSKPTSLNRADLEKTIESINKEVSYKASTNSSFKAVEKENIHFNQGYVSSDKQGNKLYSLVGKSRNKTFLVQKLAHKSVSSDSDILKISLLKDSGDLNPHATLVADSSNDVKPAHAPRTICLKQDWKCVKRRCGAAAIPCGVLSGAAYLGCLGVACVFTTGTCCKKWGPNPYN